jgi:putative SOS response-associated peptidase YedK
MCGRFVAAADPDGIARLFVVDERKDDDVPPSWNVAPTDPVRAVVEHDERRYLVALRWGLVPHWAEDERVGAKLINARAESVAEKPAFRDAFARRRCIVPADGFYEWTTDEQGRKIPHYLHRPDGAPLAFAGLWALWRPPGAEQPLRTCTIITTQAAGPAAALHDRMPVALPPDTWSTWLDRSERDPAALRAVLDEAQDELVHHRVSPEVNTPRNNHPRLLEPA